MSDNYFPTFLKIKLVIDYYSINKRWYNDLWLPETIHKTLDPYNEVIIFT